MKKQTFEIENGVLLKYNGRRKKVVIPQGVAEIGPFALAHKRRLRELTIPGSVKKISRIALFDCPGLETVRYGGPERRDEILEHGRGLAMIGVIWINEEANKAT